MRLFSEQFCTSERASDKLFVSLIRTIPALLTVTHSNQGRADYCTSRSTDGKLFYIGLFCLRLSNILGNLSMSKPLIDLIDSWPMNVDA